MCASILYKMERRNDMRIECDGGDGGDGGDSGGGRYSSFLRYRPAFMERDMVAPSWEVLGGFDQERRRLRLLRMNDRMTRRRMMSVPDAPHGYLSDCDDEEEEDHNEAEVNVVVHQRRRELLGSDISFTWCLMLFIFIGWVLWGGFRLPTMEQLR